MSRLLRFTSSVSKLVAVSHTLGEPRALANGRAALWGRGLGLAPSRAGLVSFARPRKNPEIMENIVTEPLVKKAKLPAKAPGAAAVRALMRRNSAAVHGTRASSPLQP